jgi:quinol monooxygenase YgiN
MSPPVLAGFAGVLVAAAATGMLAGRCVRRPHADVILWVLWSVATLGLTVALAAQSLGFATGFSPVTFRAVQLCALLLVPLALAWGLVELVARNEAVRFGIRLVCGAVIVVGAVILTTDPLTAEPFGKSWPSVAGHAQPFSLYALDLAEGVAILAVAVSVALVFGRARDDSRPSAAVGLVGLAVLLTVAPRLSLPDSSAYPLLGLVAAGLVWFGMTRVKDEPGGDSGRGGDYWPEEGIEVHGDGGVPAGRYGAYGPPVAAEPRGRPAFATFPEPGPGPLGAPGPSGRQGQGQPARPMGPERPGWPPPEPGTGRPAADERQAGPPGPDRTGARGPERTGPIGVEQTGPQGPKWPGPQGPTTVPSGRGVVASPGPENAMTAGPDSVSGPQAREAPAARPYGRILIFTVLEDRVADFDRLAEQAAEEVGKAEPDTLVYVIHLVPNAPLQRIFYEIYRDRAAFEWHENQPYMKRFVTARRACVLATNVIELRLKYAKIAPLPAPASRPPVPSLPPELLQPLPPGGRRYGGG